MTKKQKQDYNKELRDRWNAAKKLLDDKRIKVIDAIMRTHGLNYSRTGFFIVYRDMQKQGLDGVPYVDAKTYKGWRESGFQVRKGEKSTLGGITWVGASKEGPSTSADNTNNTDESGEGENRGFFFPKSYKLFHRSQVDAIVE